MKSRYTKSLIVVLLLAIASPAMANTTTDITVPLTAEARAVQLQNRLEEIQSMDKDNLSGTEKRMLRREVKQIKKEMAAISGGVYLSVGAIILIALLLILLL